MKEDKKKIDLTKYVSDQLKKRKGVQIIVNIETTTTNNNTCWAFNSSKFSEIWIWPAT